jgi:4-diphosphocytidyl-2-C-methyl-D-erythritol kinase
MAKISKRAYAKINMGLEIVNKRSDGFHNINTVFTRIPLYDTITMETSEGLNVSCNPSLNIPEEQNLAYIAAEKYCEFHKIDPDVNIQISKKIPHGAGLGGGSSDAATVLLGLDELFERITSYDVLFELAASIGSDVPFFLKEGTAKASGRGEILDYFDYEIPYHILIVDPEIHISTKWAYDSLNASTVILPEIDFKNAILNSLYDSNILKKSLFNDFENIVFRNYPDLLQLKEQFYDYGAIYAQMSGSGSSFFALFQKPEQIRLASNKLHELKCYQCS